MGATKLLATVMAFGCFAIGLILFVAAIVAVSLLREQSYSRHSPSEFLTFTIGQGFVTACYLKANDDAYIKSIESYPFGGGSKRWHLLIASRDRDSDVEFGGHVFISASSLPATRTWLVNNIHRGQDGTFQGIFLEIFENVLWITRSDAGFSKNGSATLYFDPIRATTVQLQLNYVFAIVISALLLSFPLFRVRKHLKIKRRIREKRCLNCGYNTSRSGDLCPECGQLILPKSFS